MIDKEMAVDIAANHIAAVNSDSVDILGFDFAAYRPAEASAFSPGPSDRNGWRVYFNYLNGMEGHHIICVDSETGEVYFTFSM